jgi:hypothetical protein
MLELLPGLPPELLLLPPLALAAGIDLYLTLLVLGAAPTLPWWPHPMPGALGDLDSPGVMIMLGTLYLLEFSAERFPATALVWNAFHAVIRPVAGALLALLLLDAADLPVVIAGVLAAGALASFAHAVRSGGAVVRWLGSAPTPHVLLVSLLEDAIVLGLVVLALDQPLRAAGVAGALALLAVATAPSYARAFAFAVRLAAARLFQPITYRRWMGSDELPTWVRRALHGDTLAAGGGLRGSPVGAYRLPGAPRFAWGWIVIRGSSPLFICPRGLLPGRAGGSARAIDVGGLLAQNVADSGFFRRVDLRSRTGGARSCLFFGVDGPSAQSLESEFLPARPEDHAPASAM